MADRYRLSGVVAAIVILLVASSMAVYGRPVAVYSFDRPGTGFAIDPVRGPALEPRSVPQHRWVDGISGTAIRFDGGNRTGLRTRQPFDHPTGAMSISLWLYPFRSDTVIRKGSELPRMVYQAESSSSHWINFDGGILGERVILGVGDPRSSDRIGASTSEDVLDALRWYHLVAVYDGREASIFVDGRRIAHRRVGTAFYGLGPVWTIGGNGFAGALDEIRIYDRALRPETIERLYHRHSDRVEEDPSSIGS